MLCETSATISPGMKRVANLMFEVVDTACVVSVMS